MNTLTTYKFSLTAVMLLLTTTIVGGSILIQHNPAISARAIAALLRRPILSFEIASGNRLLAFAGTLFSRDTPTSLTSEFASSVPVLVYHGVTTRSDGTEINLTQAQFKDHMFALKRAGYQTISLDDFYAFLRGEKQVPAKSFLITFDDGRADSFYGADPVLAATGYTASMYVITKYMEESKMPSYYLAEEEIKMMRDTGRWEIEAHTHAGHGNVPTDSGQGKDHFFSSHEWLPSENRVETTEEYFARTENDMRTAKDILQKIVEKPVIAFAFPFGDIGQNRPDGSTFSPMLVEHAGDLFPILFIQQHPEMHFSHVTPEPGREPYLVKRVDAGHIKDGRGLVRMLDGGATKMLPFADSFDGDDPGWVRAWGTLSRSAPGTLTLSAERNQSGGSFILDGSGAWHDYRVKAIVEPPNPSGIVMWLRFETDSRNAACNFGNDFAHVEQTVDGVKRVIKGIRRANLIPNATYTVETEVVGRRVRCILNGEVLVDTEFLDAGLEQGGIGFKTWDERLGLASVTLSSVEVSPAFAEEE